MIERNPKGFSQKLNNNQSGSTYPQLFYGKFHELENLTKDIEAVVAVVIRYRKVFSKYNGGSDRSGRYILLYKQLVRSF